VTINGVVAKLCKLITRISEVVLVQKNLSCSSIKLMFKPSHFSWC